MDKSSTAASVVLIMSRRRKQPFLHQTFLGKLSWLTPFVLAFLTNVTPGHPSETRLLPSNLSDRRALAYLARRDGEILVPAETKVCLLQTETEPVSEVGWLLHKDLNYFRVKRDVIWALGTHFSLILAQDNILSVNYFPASEFDIDARLLQACSAPKRIMFRKGAGGRSEISFEQ